MKKVIVSVLLVVTLVLFAGCGEKGDSGSAVADAGSVGGSAAVDDASADIAADDAGSDAAEPEAIAYEKGIVSDTGFESEFLNLRFTAPENFVMSTEAELDDIMGIAIDEADLGALQEMYSELTTTYEMMAVSSSGMSNAIVMTEKLMLSNMTEEQYVESLTTEMAGYTFDEISTTALAGQDYTALTGRTEEGGAVLVQDYLLKKTGDRMLIVLITCADGYAAEKDAMLAAFAPY